MAGQNQHFAQHAPEKIPYAIDRYVKETSRLYDVLDRPLAGRVGDDYMPIWRAIRGSCRGSVSNRISTTFQTCGGGLRWWGLDRRLYAPMRKANPTRTARRLPAKPDPGTRRSTQTSNASVRA